MAKYDGLRKQRRNDQIVDIRLRQPELALSEIGSIFHLSRQRVYQILKRNTLKELHLREGNYDK